jgi:cell division transport system permease protein
MPFMVEGFVLGMVGAGIAFGLQWFLYDALQNRIEAVDVLEMFKMVPFEQLLMPMAIVFGAAGMFVGILGSHTSIRKFLNV